MVQTRCKERNEGTRLTLPQREPRRNRYTLIKEVLPKLHKPIHAALSRELKSENESW